MLAQTGAAFVVVDQANLQEVNECGPCLLYTSTSQICGMFERPLHEQERRTALAVGIFTADMNAVLGKMSAEDFEINLRELKAKLADTDIEDREIICDLLGSGDAARLKRVNANTVNKGDMRELITCGSTIKGSSLALPYLSLPYLTLPCRAVPFRAVPCLALRCLALPCLALPCLALPCLALPCLALPCHAMPCLALPCLALPCLALPCLQ